MEWIDCTAFWMRQLHRRTVHCPAHNSFVNGMFRDSKLLLMDRVCLANKSKNIAFSSAIAAGYGLCVCVIYNPLLYQATSRSGFFFCTISRTSGSNVSTYEIVRKRCFIVDSHGIDSKGQAKRTLILAIWLKNAQPNGVAKINMKPTKPVWMGALANGYRRNRPLFANVCTTIGVITARKKGYFVSKQNE